MLDWIRAKKDHTICATRRTWESRCRKYSVVESVGKFSGMGTRYYAILRGDGFEELISVHRKKLPARAACEKHANRQVKPAKKVKQVTRGSKPVKKLVKKVK